MNLKQIEARMAEIKEELQKDGADITALRTTDESFSLLLQSDDLPDYRAIVLLQALCQVYWLVGTVIGLGLGALIPPQVVGFDFALAALFVILAQHHYYRRERRPLLLLGALAIAAALVLVRLQWLDGRQALAVAIAMLLMLLFFVPRQSIMGEKS